MVMVMVSVRDRVRVRVRDTVIITLLQASTGIV
jgi:hypothetical protein